jgi:hypothetical protein
MYDVFGRLLGWNFVRKCSVLDIDWAGSHIGTSDQPTAKSEMHPICSEKSSSHRTKEHHYTNSYTSWGRWGRRSSMIQ